MPFEPVRDAATLERAARRSRDGGIRRRRRVRHHRALGQELPQDHPPAARAPRPVRAVRRRALRRHARRRGRVRARLRSRRRRGGRGQADGARAAERARDRRAHGVRLPDGAAAHRRGEDGFRRQHAAAAAGGRRRRRTDRDRHRHRGARLLPGAGREIPARATKRSSRAEGRGRGRVARGPPQERAIADGVSRACARDPRRARGRGARGPRAAHRRAAAVMGRRDDRLSPPADRQPVVHAEPRGSREGAGGGHPLRRRADAARASKSTRTATRARFEVSQHHNDGDGVWHEFGRATLPARGDPRRRGHAAQHGARARGCRALPPRRQVFPAARRGGPAGDSRSRVSPSPSSPRC